MTAKKSSKSSEPMSERDAWLFKEGENAGAELARQLFRRWPFGGKGKATV